MSEYRVIEFIAKENGKDAVLWRIESRWGGYTYDTVDFLIDITKRLETIRCEESDRTKIIAKLHNELRLAYLDDKGDHVFKDASEPAVSEDWYAAVDLTDPSHARYRMCVFMSPTLGEELDNVGCEDRKELFESFGFREVGDDPLDVGVFVALRDGIPMSEGGLRHLKEMLESLPDGGGDGGGGFIPRNCGLDDDIVEVY